MQKSEFEQRIGAEVTTRDYKKVETVYNWYPVDLTKDDIAALYKRFGMTLILDMMPRALKSKEIEEKIWKVKSAEWNLKELLKELKEGGDIGLERIIDEN